MAPDPLNVCANVLCDKINKAELSVLGDAAAAVIAHTSDGMIHGII